MPSDTRLDRLRRFAHWMDAGIAVPGTRLRFGLDPIIGLIPGLGDGAGAVLGGWVLLEAVRLGVSRATLVRMAYNIALDALVGTVPFVGDAFDFFSKANLRNVALLERHVAHTGSAGRADRVFVAVLIGSIGMVCLGLAIASALVARGLLNLVAGVR